MNELTARAYALLAQFIATCEMQADSQSYADAVAWARDAQSQLANLVTNANDRPTLVLYTFNKALHHAIADARYTEYDGYEAHVELFEKLQEHGCALHDRLKGHTK
jgi:hypothetical protein